MVYTEAQKELSKIGDGMVTQIQKAIKDSKKYNTGRMYNSVKVKMGLSGMVITIGAPYSKFVLEGRKAGKRKPPIRAILSWIDTPHGTSFYNKVKQTKKNLTKIGAAAMVSYAIKKRNIGGYSIQPMKKQLTVEAIFSKMQTQAFKDLEAAYVRDLENELLKEPGFSR